MLTFADKEECFAHKLTSDFTFASLGVFLPDNHLKLSFVLSDIPITPSIFSAIICKLDPNKACGLDGILLKCAPISVLFLSKLCNKYLSPCFPSC